MCRPQANQNLPPKSNAPGFYGQGNRIKLVLRKNDFSDPSPALLRGDMRPRLSRRKRGGSWSSPDRKVSLAGGGDLEGVKNAQKHKVSVLMQTPCFHGTLCPVDATQIENHCWRVSCSDSAPTAARTRSRLPVPSTGTGREGCAITHASAT